MLCSVCVTVLCRKGVTASGTLLYVTVITWDLVFVRSRYYYNHIYIGKVFIVSYNKDIAYYHVMLTYTRVHLTCTHSYNIDENAD